MGFLWYEYMIMFYCQRLLKSITSVAVFGRRHLVGISLNTNYPLDITCEKASMITCSDILHFVGDAHASVLS